MKTSSSFVAAVAASIALLASGPARAAIPVGGTVDVSPNTWTFTKSGAPWAEHAVTFAQPALDAMVFDVATTGVAPTRVRRMTFQVSGTVQGPEVANFQLVYYPGVGRAGVVVGSNTSTGGTLGVTSAVVDIDLVTPLAVEGDFAGTFALQVDVNGARAFFFQPQLQSVVIEENGIPQNLLATADLPLPGDSFYVK